MSIKIPNKKIVVVLPAYNAEKTLQKTLDSIPKDYVDDVLLVDDCSKDSTVKLAKSLGIKTFVHEKNLGYGGNQKTCYREALKLGADIAVMVHPDFQYDPVFIPDMITPIAEGRAEAVFGSRMIIKGGARKGGMPMWKYIANISLTAVANFFLRLRLSEYHSGFRAYSKKALETMPIEVNSNNFVFDTQIIAQLKVFKLKIAETPITTKYFPGASMIGFFKSVEYGLSILLVLFSYVLHRFGIRRDRTLVPKVSTKCLVCISEKAQIIYEATPNWSNTYDKLRTYHITDTDRLHGPIVQCVKCDLIYVPEIYNPDLSLMYENQALDTEYLKEEKGRRIQSRRIAQYLKSLIFDGELLEVGPGPGFFLDEAKKIGFKVSGIESGKVWVKYSKEQFGLTGVNLGSFEDLTKYPDNHFSIIAAWDVIEHIKNPNELIKLIYKKLKPGGVVALSTPLIDSLVSKVFAERWHAVIPSHVVYFTKKTLRENFENEGFILIKLKTYTRFFSAQYLLNRLLKTKNESFLRKLILPVSFFDEAEVYFRK